MTPNQDPSPEDETNPDIETPEPINEPDWQDDLRAYHSHLCLCPACTEAEHRRQSRLKNYLERTSQW